jgi:hypothetical protein
MRKAESEPCQIATKALARPLEAFPPARCNLDGSTAQNNINAQEKELCTTSSLASMYGASVT